jgi:hypothetical protein
MVRKPTPAGKPRPTLCEPIKPPLPSMNIFMYDETYRRDHYPAARTTGAPRIVRASDVRPADSHRKTACVGPRVFFLDFETIGVLNG